VLVRVYGAERAGVAAYVRKRQRRQRRPRRDGARVAPNAGVLVGPTRVIALPTERPTPPGQCRSRWGLPELSSVSQAHGAFGEDAFGRRAEAAARFLGTPRYIAAQTLLVIAWIAVNAVAVSLRWDPYPFILLNLAFSTQAAYAAPLILLAQTRQAERDKYSVDLLEAHREEVMRHMEAREAALRKETDELKDMLVSNTELTRQDKQLTERVETLTSEIQSRLQSR
jgi:uncharacterized membrane protein